MLLCAQLNDTFSTQPNIYPHCTDTWWRSERMSTCPTNDTGDKWLVCVSINSLNQTFPPKKGFRALAEHCVATRSLDHVGDSWLTTMASFVPGLSTSLFTRFVLYAFLMSMNNNRTERRRHLSLHFSPEQIHTSLVWRPKALKSDICCLTYTVYLVYTAQL